MKQELQQQAVLLTEKIMRTYYYQRDIYGVLNWMAPDASWIGPGQQEKKYTLDEMRSYFEMGKDSIPSCEVSSPDLRAVDLGDDYCLVTGSMTIHTIPGSQLILEVDQRVSFIFRFTRGEFQVIHMHISNPYEEMEQDEYFPHKIGSQSYQYLQRILREKTEVLDMITANINGGLKGSNDDSSFSYFYVNEGLPQMLGYTYDEFMEKTGRTAVGAVYPPDLDAALADCTRCFLEGSVYSTEYRMEKKDGSLIWVLDSGRKVVDSEGITRINSIIIDITPLKQALFELGIERERYRIALHHITGAMCEYDVARDFFTLYQQTEWKGECEVNQLEIPHFSKEICSGVYAGAEDGAVFLAMCTGQCEGSLEFHTRLLSPDDLWCWAQFSCSVIFDYFGMPVRAIGILKDITQEKQRNQELLNQAQRDGLTGLLNQTASKEAIQDCLSQNRDLPAQNIALFMIDLDRFKEINDVNGHLYGNEVLIKTARILEEAADKDSITGRIGGDEFIILLRDAKQKTVTRIAEEIVWRVREIGLNKGVATSCSVGIAYRAYCEEEFTHFFERADKALYCAKDNGRDGFFIDAECPEFLVYRKNWDVMNHYDSLIDENNDPVRDTQSLRDYMDKWDGRAFVDLMELDKTKGILEIGVGSGRLAAKTIPLVKEFTGIDISPKTIARANENLSAFENKTLICGDFLTYEFNQQFDVVYVSLTFFHIKEKEQALNKIAGLLKSDGKFVISISKDQSSELDFGTRKIPLYPDTSEELTILMRAVQLKVINQIETEFAWILESQLAIPKYKQE